MPLEQVTSFGNAVFPLSVHAKSFDDDSNLDTGILFVLVFDNKVILSFWHKFVHFFKQIYCDVGRLEPHTEVHKRVRQDGVYCTWDEN